MSFEIEGEALGKAIKKGHIERIHLSTPPPVFRPIGNAGPLGLSAFAATTLVLSIANADLVPIEIKPTYIGLAFFYGGFVQMLAGMWEFVTNNTFGAVAFTSYGGFWTSLAYFVMYVEEKIPVEDLHKAVGLYLLPWCFFTFFMTVAAYKISVALFITFALVELTLVLLCAGNFEDDEDTIKAGGWVGILLAFAAWYCASAFVINGTWKQDLIPLWPYKFPEAKQKEKNHHHFHHTNVEHHAGSDQEHEHDIEHELDHDEHEIKTGKSPKIGVKVK